MAIFVGASGQAGIQSDATRGGFGSASSLSPDRPAFWSLIILVALIAAVVVIARGAM